MNETDFASYADDKTSNRTVNTIDEAIQTLAHDSVILFKWFYDNQTKAYISQCYPLVKKGLCCWIVDMEVKDSVYKKLLVIRPDTKINFNGHNKNMKSQPQS